MRSGVSARRREAIIVDCSLYVRMVDSSMGFSPSITRSRPGFLPHHNMHIERRVLRHAEQTNPQRQVHLHAARACDVAEVDDVRALPAEPLAEQYGHAIL